jgi:hypothetical protein
MSNHDRSGVMIRALKRMGGSEQQMPDYVQPEYQRAWQQLQKQRLRNRKPKR